MGTEAALDNFQQLGGTGSVDILSKLQYIVPLRPEAVIPVLRLVSIWGRRIDR